MDRINERIVELLHMRVELARTIALFKKEQGMPLEDLQREDLQYRELEDLARAHALEPDLVKEMFSLIITYCKSCMRKE